MAESTSIPNPDDNLGLHPEARYSFQGVLPVLARDGLLRVDIHGIICHVNSQLASTLTVSPNTLLGTKLLAWLDPDSRTLVEHHLQTETPTVCTSIPELTFRTLSGIPKTFMVTFIPIHDREHDGLKWDLAFLKSGIDTKTHRQLLAERNLLRTLLDSVPVLVFAKDRYGRFIVANRAFQQMNGFPRSDDILGKTDAELYSVDLAETFRHDDQAVMASGNVLKDRFERFVTSTGEERRMITYKAPLYDEDGKVYGIMGASRDITDLKRTEEALHAREELFRLILENTRDIAYSVDLCTGKITYVSPAVKKVLGYTQEEVLEKGMLGWVNRIHRADRMRLIERLRSLKTPVEEEHHERIEYRFRRKRGDYRWLSLSSTFVLDAKGIPVAEVGALRDITSYKKAEEAIHKAHRMEATATLAGGVAHKFNNLMVGVLGSAELLLARHHEDPVLNEQIATIVKSAQEASSLARRMLAYAQGGKYNPTPLNLNRLIDETLGIHQASFPDSILLERHLDPDLWNIKADPTQINQLLVDLTNNAIESMFFENRRSSGCLRLSTRNLDPEQAQQILPADMPAGRYVCLSVEDSGVGMNRSLLRRIFDPFFTTKTQGRGLGLAAAYGIIKHHGGHIEVTSEEGVGSLFCIYFPAVFQNIAAGLNPPPAKKIWQPAHVARSGEVILLVDDDTVVRNVTRDILERLGYQVLVAVHGADAIEVAQAHPGPIHLALLDMSMPVMSGAEAFPRLKSLRPAMKIIIVSGFELDPVTQRVLDAGAVTFLHKPFRMDLLASKVRSALEN